MLLRATIETDMELKAIDENSKCENKRQITHQYKAGDIVLIVTSK